jgi:hypothetical protein
MWLWQAFEVLSARRNYNQAGPQPIALSEMLAYGTFSGFDSEWRLEALVRVISALDAIYLDHHTRKKAPSKGSKSVGKTQRRPRS